MSRHAFEITRVLFDGEGQDRPGDGSATLTLAEWGSPTVSVPVDFMQRYRPAAGDFYVVDNGKLSLQNSIR